MELLTFPSITNRVVQQLVKDERQPGLLAAPSERTVSRRNADHLALFICSVGIIVIIDTDGIRKAREKTSTADQPMFQLSDGSLKLTCAEVLRSTKTAAGGLGNKRLLPRRDRP